MGFQRKDTPIAINVMRQNIVNSGAGYHTVSSACENSAAKTKDTNSINPANTQITESLLGW